MKVSIYLDATRGLCNLSSGGLNPQKLKTGEEPTTAYEGACVNTPPQGGAREPSRIPADGTLFTREDPGWLVKLLETRRSPSSFLELARKGLHRAAAI